MSVRFLPTSTLICSLLLGKVSVPWAIIVYNDRDQSGRRNYINVRSPSKVSDDLRILIESKACSAIVTIVGPNRGKAVICRVCQVVVLDTCDDRLEGFDKPNGSDSCIIFSKHTYNRLDLHCRLPKTDHSR